MPLNTPVRITKQNLYPLFTTQVFLIRLLYTLLTYIITTDIIIISLNISHWNFTDIPQSMPGSIIGILPDSTPLNIKTRKFEKLFLEYTALFRWELRHKHLMRISGITGIHPTVLHIFHSLQQLLFRNIQCAAKIESIQFRHLSRHECDIIRRLIEHQ